MFRKIELLVYYKEIKTSVKFNNVFMVTLNRPTKFNAFNKEVVKIVVKIIGFYLRSFIFRSKYLEFLTFQIGTIISNFLGILVLF